MNAIRQIDTPSGPYQVVVASERSDRLVEVRNPEGVKYWVALDQAGRAIVCTCPGWRNRQHCKHQDMVEETLYNGGLPLRTEGQLQWNPVDGYEVEGRPDPFAHLDTGESWDRQPGIGRSK